MDRSSTVTTPEPSRKRVLCWVAGLGIGIAEYDMVEVKILKNGGPCTPEGRLYPVCCSRVATQQDAESVEAGAKKAKVEADITAPVDSTGMDAASVNILPPATGAAATMSVASQFH